MSRFAGEEYDMRNSMNGLWCRRLWPIIVAFLLGLAPAAAGTQLLANPGFSELKPDGKLGGWTSFVWYGDARMSPNEAAYNGAKAVMLANTGPAKQAIFQTVPVQRCSYRLSAEMAGFELQPQEWDQAATILVSLKGGRDVSHPVFKTATDWRHVEMVFTAETGGEAIIYFFNIGSGAVFVAEPKLEPLGNCTPEPDSFQVANAASAPLTYEPPVTIEDTLLAGYCRNQAFATRDVCKRLAAVDVSKFAAGEKKPPVAITTFERSSVLSWPSREAAALLQANPGANVVVPEQYIFAKSSTQAMPKDWRGYDWLRFEVINPTKTPQPLAVEVWDDKTTGYWSRVTWMTQAVPGRSVLEMPLQIFVGEKSTIGDRARLNLAAVEKLVFVGTKTELLIDKVRIEQEPADTTAFPELIALDAGPASSPVMKGFMPLTASTQYRKARGWGLAPGTAIAKVEDRRHPDNLHRDWISFAHGGLDFDLPDGAYHVWMVVEDPGYWDYYPSWRSRQIHAGGKLVLDEKPTAADFFAKYYRNASDEDWPGDDIWSRYVKPRYKPIEFDAAAEQGQLKIRFDGHADPYATALSALVIYPVTKSAEGEKFIARLNERLHEQFDQESRQLIPPLPTAPRPAANALDGKLWVFSRSPALDIAPNEWPAAAEMTVKPGVAVAQGEFAPLTIGLFAGEDLDLESVESVLDGAGIAVTPYRVRNKIKRVTADGSVYSNLPRILDPLEVSAANPLHMKAGRSYRLWLDVAASAAAAPGVRQGTVTLRFAGGGTHAVAVKAEVLPWRLPDADVPIGYLGISPSYPDTTYPEVADKRFRETIQSVALLRRYGMTAVTGGLGPIVFSGYENGHPKLDLRDYVRSMELIKQHFGGEVATYAGLHLQGLQISPPQDTAGQYHKPFEAIIDGILGAVDAKRAEIGGLPLLHILGDEPTEAAVPNVVAAARAFKKARPGVRTGVFTSLLDIRKDAARELAGEVTKLYLYAHTEAAINFVKQRGSECSFYNRDTRYDRGVYLFKMRDQGCQGHMQFAFSVVQADPWYGLDGREDEYAALWTHPDGRLRITLELARYHEAITDYRTLLALERAIAQSPASPPARAARNWLLEIESKIQVGSDKPKAFTEDGLDKVREDANAHLRALVEANGPLRPVAPAKPN
jgi:hypothetical protein